MSAEIRKRHAHTLRMAAVDAYHDLNGVWGRRHTMEPTEFKTALQAACDRVGATMSDLEDFGALSDADAEKEFDGAPDQPWQVTLPKGAER